MKLQVRGRVLRNVDEDCPGIVVAVIPNRDEVTWAITGQDMSPLTPPEAETEGMGVINLHGEAASQIGEAAPTFTVDEIVAGCDDAEALMYLASTSTLAFIQTVAEIAPRGMFAHVRSFTDWWEETMVAVKTRLVDEFSE